MVSFVHHVTEKKALSKVPIFLRFFAHFAQFCTFLHILHILHIFAHFAKFDDFSINLPTRGENFILFFWIYLYHPMKAIIIVFFLSIFVIFKHFFLTIYGKGFLSVIQCYPFVIHLIYRHKTILMFCTFVTQLSNKCIFILFWGFLGFFKWITKKTPKSTSQNWRKKSCSTEKKALLCFLYYKI